MPALISKKTQSELSRLLQVYTAPTALPTKAPGVIPAEDLMERGADLLEDEWARRFFMTICGFTRLLQLLLPASATPTIIAEKAGTWLFKRYPQAKNHPALTQAIETLTNLCLQSVNLNITLKRLTAILSKSERAYFAQGLLDTCAPDGILNAEQYESARNLLGQILLSEANGMELLEIWRLNPWDRR